MWRFLGAFLAAIHALSSASVPFKLQSRTMRWDRQSLFLDGDVQLQHPKFRFEAPSSQVLGTSVKDFERLDCPSCHLFWVLSEGNEGELICPGEVTYEAKTGVWHGKACPGSRVQYRDCHGELQAQTARASMEFPSGTLTEVVFEGDVRYRAISLQKNSFLSVVHADRACMDPVGDRMRLEAIPPKKIFIWNRDRTHSLSCQTLHLWRDPITQEWLYQGEGTVQVSLTRQIFGSAIKGSSLNSKGP